MNPVYLDYHATTPVDPRVLAKMLPFFTERFGNPHSKQHAFGWDARDAADTARAQVAALISLEHRLPHNLHVGFDGVAGEALLMALGDLAVSTGSACASGSQAPSHVLQAIGATSDRAGASIRFGLGRTTTAAEIDFAIDRVSTVVAALRRQVAPA